MPIRTRGLVCGPRYAGLAAVGYAVADADNTPLQARAVLVPRAEPSPGAYVLDLALPAGFVRGVIDYDTGGVSPRHFLDIVDYTGTVSGLTIGGVTVPGVVASNGGMRLAAIDRALAAQLLNWGLGTAATIRFYDAEPSAPLPDAGDPLFCFWPGAQKNIAPWEHGAGRINTGADGTIRVRVWSRQERNRAYEEDVSLHDGSGVLEIAHRVIDALHNYFPHDADTLRPLTARPLSWQDQSEAVRHTQSKSRGWLGVTLTFAVKWRVGLDIEAFV